MLYEIMKHIKNFFIVPESRLETTFTIKNGTVDLPFLDGQYFLIEGSVLNDGVYRYPATDLKDETFTGSVTGLAIPKDFLDLVAEIEAFQLKCTDVTPYQSESFGGYSYSRFTDGKGGASTWVSMYRTRLDAWRKV